MSYSFTIDVCLYNDVKVIIFYNVQTTILTFVDPKNEIYE
jgi:hypothetical protein